MIQQATRTGMDQFIYRGITVIRSSNQANLPKWIAEIRRQRAFEFLRAGSMAEMRAKIDEALAKRPVE